MAYYDSFKAKWATLTGTTAAKLAAINAATVSAPQKAMLTPSQLINAVVPADLQALTTAQVGLLTLLTQGGLVDCSPGTTIRAVAQAIFVGKATTLSQLAALVAPFDNATILFYLTNGYSRPFDMGDVAAAGVS